MKRRSLLLAAAGVPITEKSDAQAIAQNTWLNDDDVDFGVLYYLNISSEASGLPLVIETDFLTGEPTGDLVHRPYFGVLSEGGVKVAELVSRAAAKVILTKEEGREFVSYTFSRFGNLSPRRCYQPRHVMILYSKQGVPVRAIEVCFTCRIVATFPRVVKVSGTNFFALAAFIDSHKLPLGPEYPTLEAFEARHADSAGSDGER